MRIIWKECKKILDARLLLILFPLLLHPYPQVGVYSTGLHSPKG